MQSPPQLQESTLNTNIAKELIWKRNAPYFYQTLYTQVLEWPSLAVEWWIDQFVTPNSNPKQQKSLCYVTYGTHTSGEEKNYLTMAKVYLPNQQYLKKLYREKNIKPNEAIKKNDGAMDEMIVIQHEVEHDGEVNRIRHHPKKTNLIATRTPKGEVHIFDKTTFKTGRVKVNPTVVLLGHEVQGYSLEWNPHKDGNIVAGSYDGKLTLWDISTKQQKNNRIYPLCYFNHHEKQIEDVSHNQFHDCIFASCDDQAQVVLWDTRNSKHPVHNFIAGEGPLYSIQFSPLNRNVFCTGGEEQIIKLWDVRNMSQPLVGLKDLHNQEINQLKWSSGQREMLWVSAGNNLTMWDLSEQKAKFVHSGHMQPIKQMDLHPFEPRTVVSVDQDNELHVFQPTRNCAI